jgi:hypothetical protein
MPMAAREVLVKGLEPHGPEHLAFDANSGDLSSSG